MIHTLTINNRILSPKVFNEIYKGLEVITGVKPRKVKEGYYVTEELRERGFTFVKLISKKIDSKYKYNYMIIELTINPSKLLGSNELEILKKEQIGEFKFEFDRYIKIIHSSLPCLNYWMVSRIDYAININTPYVKEYIELFRRGDKPKGFKEFIRMGSDREMKGGLYLFNRSITVNFYDKQDERIFNGFNKEEAKDLLRLEIQCKMCKTNTIKTKYEFDSKNVANYLRADISQNQL